MTNTADLTAILTANEQNDDFSNAVREALIWGPEALTDFGSLAAEVGFDSYAPRVALSKAVEIIGGLDRESLTEVLLSFSLCPLHRHDYAICFDDDDPGCSPIRVIHPGHDS